MSDFPTGVYRTQTCNETISNWAGTKSGNMGGQGAVRVFEVYVKSAGVSASNVTLYDGLSASSTGNAYIQVTISGENPTWNSFESGVGVLFPNGCFIATSAAIDFALVTFQTEM